MISEPMAVPCPTSLSRALVLESPLAASAEAHLIVGYGALAAFGGGTSAPTALLARPQVQVQGTSVPNGKPVATKQSVVGTDPVGGVRGIPPRGWPV
jgi:hypothetical protein